VSQPLVFQHGTAATAFEVAVVGWLAFETAMAVRPRLRVGLRAWSIAALGRFFQYHIEVQAEHRVVTDGPYRYVRHPSYTGMALVLAGIALGTGGAEYERFAARRKRLVPGVW
jgi:protein-S-isoprenylcysteine O-methyltransferase Ste14